MSSHGHSHDHGGHSHAEPSHSHSHSHSHDGVQCAGHDAEPPTEAELAAQKQERLAFDRVVASFYAYESHSLSANHRRLKDLLSLPKKQQDLLVKLGYREKLRKVDDCIAANAQFIRAIVDEVGTGMFSDPDEEPEEEEVDAPAPAVVAPVEEEEEEEYDFGSDDEYDTSSPMPPSFHGHSHGEGGGCGGHGEGSGHSHGAPAAPSPPSPKPDDAAAPTKPKKTPKPSEMDMDKIRSTLKQVVREWSVEGKPERDTAYAPILDALSTIYKDVADEDRRKIKVLSPGVGLARLAYEIAHLGFASQGNEFSFHMLLPSFFILNLTPEVNSHTIYPFVHSFSNHSSTEQMLRPVTIPDVSPANLPKDSDFSLVAGDFLDVYGSGSEDGKWDVIATSFFIDTAKNVIEYLETIKRCLAPGGTWINLGPLLWHWENNSSNDPSIELSLDEVKALCSEMGFEIKDEKIIPTGYTANGQGMLRYQYQTAFWTATLKGEQ